MLAARLASQLPARRALVQYPSKARTFASKRSKRPQQGSPDSQPAASSQSSSKPTNEPPNPDHLASDSRPVAPTEASDPKLSELPSLSTLDFTAADEQPPSDRTGARSAKDSPSSIERKTRFMSSLMVGVAALGLGMYAISLGGEWTEAELKEKRMVRFRSIAASSAVTDHYPCSTVIRYRSFDQVGTNGGESQRCVRRTLFQSPVHHQQPDFPSFSSSQNRYGPNFCPLHFHNPIRNLSRSCSP